MGKYQPYDQYKKVKSEWIGQIPQHWESAATKRRFQIVNGATPASGIPDYWDGDVVWVTPEDLGKNPAREIAGSRRRITKFGLANCGAEIVPPDSLVISTRAPIGHLAISGRELCTNQGCKALKPIRLADTRFEYYFYSVAKEHLQVLGKGTTFLELGGGELGGFDLVQPPDKERTKIADFLDHETTKIDRLIAKQERLIELLKEKRQALISHAVTKGLTNSPGANLNAEGGPKGEGRDSPSSPDTPMKDSGVEWLGKVPAHWVVTSLKRLSKKITDGEHISPTFTDEGMPFLSAKDIRDRRIDFDVDKFVSQDDGVKFRRRCNPEMGDVLVVSRGATIGRVGLVESNVEFCLLGSVILIKPDGKVVDQVFLHYLLNQTAAKEQFLLASQASAQQAIYLVDVAELIVAVPPLEEQRGIRDHLEFVTNKIDQLVMKSEEAIALQQEHRTALISAAVTGKIDVRNFKPANA